MSASTAPIPDKPTLDGLEAKWDARWQEQGIYRFDRARTRDEIYSIDTPPPTISGFLHLGTAFGYIQVDAIARFHRMFGRMVFYPMGWDDNGLPTERRVQQHYRVRCDPAVPFDPDLEIGDPVKGEVRVISRPNFVALCHRLTAEFEESFEQQWRKMGLSVDWTLTYATIDERSQRVAQRGFLANLRRGEAYAAEAPTMWDVDFRTAVAQAEVEDREVVGMYHGLAFHRLDGGPDVEVQTTRPELLPSCVALVAHPDDARYQALFGSEVLTPVFGVRVPVLAHKLAEPDKGSGIAMICTFGDSTDVQWWRELNLPLRSVIQRDGRFQQEVPAWLAGSDRYLEVAGKTTAQGRRRIVELLREEGSIIGEPRAITHQVKFYEKGDRPLEIVTSRQWYIRNGAADPTLREGLIDAGRELQWHPDFMRRRYEHWVEGLNTDWLISRQRYFGVPFPLWYKVSESGEVRWDEVILPADGSLPVDPSSDVPPGYTEAQRGAPGGFIGDPDVMDTWATSSLTPQIAANWPDDPDLFARVFPMDLRPQGPEIIRTWLFSTLLRARLEHGSLPWRHASINGWILDPDRKKMSKSLGNVLTPMPLVEQYGADGLRYWACRAASGTDTAVDHAQMKVGRRLAVKVLNATKFVLGLGTTQETTEGTIDGTTAYITEPLDTAMISQLAALIEDATESFESYQYNRALERTEAFFWQFCDDYLELVKLRAYAGGPAGRSAEAALQLALSVLIRLFAPFIPFAAEEAWSWWHEDSVHQSSWPRAAELAGVAGPGHAAVLQAASAALRDVRKAKSEGNRSQRTRVVSLTIDELPGQAAALRFAAADLQRAGVIDNLDIHEAPERRVVVELAAAEDSIG